MESNKDAIDLNKLNSEDKEEIDPQWLSLSSLSLPPPTIMASSLERPHEQVQPPSFPSICSNNFADAASHSGSSSPTSTHSPHSYSHHHYQVGADLSNPPNPSSVTTTLPRLHRFNQLLSFEQQQRLPPSFSSFFSGNCGASSSNIDVASPSNRNPNAGIVSPSNPPSPTYTMYRPYPSRSRRNPTQAPHPGKSETIPPPYPWATDHRATLHNLDYLVANGLTCIEGDVQCRHCEHKDRASFHLPSKFEEVRVFINSYDMRDRAPAKWMNPALTDCSACEQPNCMKPVVAEKKRNVNWLFMFLGQTLGCCTIEQLKYFCKHTHNHRTGAKDRVLYLSYATICNQLDPK